MKFATIIRSSGIVYRYRVEVYRYRCTGIVCKAQRKGEEDKADRGRGGKTTSGNGQAWNSPSPRGQWRTGKMEETGCEIICDAPMKLAVKR